MRWRLSLQIDPLDHIGAKTLRAVADTIRNAPQVYIEGITDSAAYGWDRTIHSNYPLDSGRALSSQLGPASTLMTAESRSQSASAFLAIKEQASQCFEHAAQAIKLDSGIREKTLAGALRRMSLQTEIIRSPLALADHCDCSARRLIGMQNQVNGPEGQGGLAEASHRLKQVGAAATSYVGRVALWSLPDTTPLTPSLQQCVVEWGGNPAIFRQLSLSGELGLRGLAGAVWRKGDWRKDRLRRIGLSIGYKSDARDIQTLFRRFASPGEEVAWLFEYGGTLVSTWSSVWGLMAPEPSPGCTDFNAPFGVSFIVPRFDDRVLVAYFSEFIQYAEL